MEWEPRSSSHSGDTVRAGANWLLLVCLALMVVLGTFLQMQSLSWGMMATELFLILVPVVAYLGLTQQPVAETLRLHWPGGRVALWSLLVGLGAAPLALVWAEFVTRLLGYEMPLGPEFYPTRLIEVIPFVTAMVVFAPFCEEALFRGVILNVHRGRGARAAILISSLFFACFHLSFVRLFVLLPVALILGFVVWQSDSLWPGVLVHAAYNAVSVSLNLVNTLAPQVELAPTAAGASIVIGMVWVILGLRRFQALRRPDEEGHDLAPRPVGCQAIIPLFLVSLIFISMSGMDLVIGVAPDLLAQGQTKVTLIGQVPEAEWRYVLRDPLDRDIGQVTCRQYREGEHLVFAYDAHHDASKGMVERQPFDVIAREYQMTAWWAPHSGELWRAELAWKAVERHGALSAAKGEKGSDPISVRVSRRGEAAETVDAPRDALLHGEWPWRLRAMPFRAGLAQRATLVHPGRWGDSPQEREYLAEGVVVIVRGAEPLWTPAGRHIAWRVTVGEDYAAWYDVEYPHDLLSYTDGSVTWLLAE